MDFDWTEDQKQLRRTIGDFAQKELGRELRARDRAGEFDRHGFKRCGEIGILGIPIPEEYGGLGADAITLAGALESLGYACPDNGLVFSIGAHLLACMMPIVEIGSPAQKQRYLPKLVDGTWIAANAMSEPSAGSDAFGLRTIAKRDGDGYSITGSKVFTTNGPVADVFLVFATTDPAKGKAGVTAFLVDKDTPGLRLGAHTEKMGMRTSSMCEVFFEDCKVPEDARLGREGMGAMLFSTSMVWERAFILAPAVGTMQRLFENAVSYVRERKQYGQAVGKFQLVASRAVDMQLRVETARGMLYRTAWLKSQGRSCFAPAALTKLHISESWVQTAQDALQMHGGYGYTEDYELSRELRDATGSRLYSGTSEIQRVIAAGMLGLG